MPSLFRLADALLFPSLARRFWPGCAGSDGQSACRRWSRNIAPFTEYLGADDVAWCDPHHAGSIADATLSALADPLRSRLIANGGQDRHAP